MNYVIRNSDNKHLLILVHGLNGSESTWKGNDQRFVENLLQEEAIIENFDLALFSYEAKIFRINMLQKIKNLLIGFFRSSPSEDLHGFNVGINDISQVLESQIRNSHQRYDTISIIAHSMGGLVTKSALSWMNNDILGKIHLFISLSVPHIGSNLAYFGQLLLGKNPPIVDLKTMGEFTTQLNNRYSNLTIKPKVIYQSGNQDTVVLKQSAIPPNVHIDDTVSTNDDHFSVLLIKDRKNNTLFDVINRELNIVTQPFVSVNVGINEGTLFKYFVETMASKLKIAVAFEGFSEDDLKTPLREGNIHGLTVQDFFGKIGLSATNKSLNFTVEKEKGTLNFVLNKK